MIALVAHSIIPAALSILPSTMDSPEARAMLIAIGLQESKFLDRQQKPVRPGMPAGPARGFWQFERLGAVKGVMTHPSTRALAIDVLRDLRYADRASSVDEVHRLLGDNDVLACAFARLLLWTLPARLPKVGQVEQAWAQYLEGWRPGKPHRLTWPANYDEAWQRINYLTESRRA